MTLEAYQKEYAERINRRNAYMLTFLKEKLSELDFDDEEKVLQYMEEVNELLGKPYARKRCRNRSAYKVI